MAVDALREHLSPFAFEGVEFPAAESSLTAGHDSAKHAGYRQRGADVETTGPRAKVIKVKVPLYNGLRWPRPLFPDVYAELVRALDGRGEGLLTHPTRGLLTVHVDEWVEQLDGKTKDGTTLEITFTEQRGEASLLDFNASASPADVAIAAAAEVEVEAATLGLADRFLGFVDDVTAVMDELASADATMTQAIASADALVRRCEEDLADPALATSSCFPLRGALGATQAAVAARVAERSGDRPGTFRLPVAMSIAEVAAHPDVYGDAARMGELLAVNELDDPGEIPAGTTLLVPV
ncbi:MAG: DNA circularization N-terminal domain-containing protein [Deltaproteobacteria bacterium]|nr:DNA circularization N-terminal domain-containing protein [Myxococcales bacterium]MDP3219746.1 DNA circularization N-terminal domain-containing protein [Deltaproteobacteria bacterium]